MSLIIVHATQAPALRLDCVSRSWGTRICTVKVPASPCEYAGQHEGADLYKLRPGGCPLPSLRASLHGWPIHDWLLDRLVLEDASPEVLRWVLSLLPAGEGGPLWRLTGRWVNQHYRQTSPRERVRAWLLEIMKADV